MTRKLVMVGLSVLLMGASVVCLIMAIKVRRRIKELRAVLDKMVGGCR